MSSPPPQSGEDQDTGSTHNSPNPKNQALTRDDLVELFNFIDKKKTTPAPPPPDAFKFERRGYAEQYAFNNSVAAVLDAVPPDGHDDTATQIAKAKALLKGRNDTLKVADTNPEVFNFLETKKRAEEIKVTNPLLAEFLEKAEAEKKRNAKRKRSRSRSPPFRPRGTGPRQPANRHSGFEKTYGRSNTNIRDSSYRDRSGDKCRNCQKFGHWAAECRSKK